MTDKGNGSDNGSTFHLHRKSPAHLPFQAKLVSGAIAGVIGTSIIFPLDFVKTRLQNNPALTMKQVIESTLNGSGGGGGGRKGILGFYRGLAPNLIGVTPEKAIKLAVNDSMREYIAKNWEGHGDSHSIKPINGMIAGATAGFCQVIATNPMEIVKIRMQMSGSGSNFGTLSTSTSTSTSSSTSSSLSMSEIVRSLGLRGLYRGTTATLCRDVPFSLLFFQSSASLRGLFGRLLGDEYSSVPGQESVEVVFMAGILAGSLAAFLVTPMDVVKTRLQTSNHSSSTSSSPRLLDCYKDIYEKEGMRAFFRGSLQRCFIVAPLFGITLLVYEIQKSLLKTPANK